MRTCLTQCKKRKKSLLFFLPSCSFPFSSDSITAELQLQTKQCHFSAKQGVLVIYATDIRYFRCLSLFHLSFLHFTEILLLPLSANKGVAVAESPGSCGGVGLPWQGCPCSHSDRLPWAGHSFCSTGKGRNALQCHISDRRTLQSRGCWGEGCFCCVPKIVESGHWRWKTSSCSAVPLHSTGAETTQSTSPYKMLFCHFEPSGTVTGEDWLMLSQDLSDLLALHPLAIRVIIDWHQHTWWPVGFYFLWEHPFLLWKNEVMWSPCDPVSALYTDRRVKLIIAFYNALLWLRLLVPLSNQFGAKTSLNCFFSSCALLLIKSNQNRAWECIIDLGNGTVRIYSFSFLLP